MDAPTHPTRDAAAPPCPGCGRRRAADDANALAWSSEHARDGVVTYVCPTCTREDITLIEAGLPGRGHRNPAA